MLWGAWQRLKGWYNAAFDRAPPPSRATIERITAERADLYIYVPSPGNNIPISVQPASVDDSVLTEDNIEEAVKHLRRNKSGGASEMRSENLKGWLAELKRRKREAVE